MSDPIYDDPITQQNDIYYHPDFVVDGGNDSISSLGWHGDDAETVPYAVDTGGWYEDIRTQDSLIGFIMSKKFGSDIQIIMRKALPSASDMITFQKSKDNDEDTGENPFRYERYEIRTIDKVYTHIMYGSVNYSNDNFLEFDIDNDLNDKVVTMGGFIKKIYELDKLHTYTFLKRIILPYKSIISIEVIVHIPLQS